MHADWDIAERMLTYSLQVEPLEQEYIFNQKKKDRGLCEDVN